MYQITSMTQEAISKLTQATHEWTCWDLLENSDVVIEVIATATKIIYTADSGIEYLETTDLDEYMCEVGHLLQ